MRYVASALLAGLIALLLVAPAHAQVEGLRYTGAPSGEYVFWDGGAGLTNGLFYGGRLGIEFGEYLELRGLYLFGRGFRTDFSGYDLEDEHVFDTLQTIAGRSVHVERYGLQLQVNMAREGLVPFAQAGTGILSLSPRASEAFGQPERFRNIYVDLGAGVVMDITPRVTFTLTGSALGYRYHPGATFLTDEDLAAMNEELEDATVTRDDFEAQRVINPTLAGALTLHLGGRARGELTDTDEAFLQQFERGGLRLVAEPFYGRIDFGEALNFPVRQYVFGMNAGLDFGPFIGLRGFYWRAADPDELAFSSPGRWLQKLHLYGAEMELRLGRDLMQGLTPFLRFGGGYVDASVNFEAPNDIPIESRYFASGGAGIDLPLSPRLGVRGGIRGLLMSEQDAGDISDAGSLHSSWMYTLGLTFSLGRTPEDPVRAVARERQRAAADAEDRLEEQETEAAEQVARLEATIDSLLQRQRELEARMVALGEQPTDVRADRTEREEPGRQVRYISDREIVVPIPEEGEIYLRYGRDAPQPAERDMYAYPEMGGVMGALHPPGLNEQQIRQMVDGIVEERLAEVGNAELTGGMTQSEVRLFVQEAVREQMRQARLSGLPSEDELRSLAQDAAREELRGMDVSRATEADLRRLERRMERLDQMVTRELERTRTELRMRPLETGAADDEPLDVERQRASILRPFGRSLSALQPFIGLRSAEGPTQWMFGLRGEFSDPQRLIRFAPEGAVGIGDGASVNVLANGFAPLPMPFSDNLSPYAGAGLGFISDTGLSGLEMVFNMAGGLQYRLPNDHVFFLEYNSQDFFDVHRAVAGASIRF